MIVGLLVVIAALGDQTPPVALPRRHEWFVFCPADKLGKDHKPLCSASTSSKIPAVQISRTDGGAAITVFETCAVKAAGGFVVSQPEILVPLPQGMSPADRQAKILEELTTLMTEINTACGVNRAFTLPSDDTAAALVQVFDVKSATR